MIDAARDKPKEVARLGAERDQTLENLAAMRDRVRGVYGWNPNMRNMARIAQGAKIINNLTLMGSTAISSMADMAGTVFRFGFENAFRDGWQPYIAHLMGKNEAFGKFKTQMKALGIGIETATNARQHAIDDVFDVYRPGTWFERTLQAMNDKFFLLNLQAPETDMFKTIAAHVAVSEILRAVKAEAAGTATKAQITALRESGISANLSRGINHQYFEQGFGKTVDGVHLPNTADWNNRSAAEALEGAIAREVDIAVVTPGQEKPKWMSQPVLGLLGQFKSFVAASNERILLANLQRRDARTLQGLVASVGLGMLSYKVNSIASGQPTSDRPQDWFREAISRSGMTGWIEEANALASKGTRGTVDMYRVLGSDRPSTRFASRSAMDQLLGPTAGKVQNILNIAGSASSRDWKAADTHAVRTLNAGQNLFYVRRLLDEVENSFNRGIGVQPNR